MAAEEQGSRGRTLTHRGPNGLNPCEATPLLDLQPAAQCEMLHSCKELATNMNIQTRKHKFKGDSQLWAF